MKKFVFCIATLSAFFAVSCASNSVDSSNKNAQATEKKDVKTETVTDQTVQEKVEEKIEVSNHPLGISDERYENLLNGALLSTGNNYRLKKVIEKLRAGEEVYIAALGGSVTEGAGPKDASGREQWKLGYAYQFRDKLVAEYAKDEKKVFFNGAGLSGTPSQLGLIRYESDVVEVLGHNPDLLIIEFAVNDDGGEQTARAFEALVRNALVANEECAVIALYSAATYGNSAGSKRSIAEFYDIPQINVLSLVQRATSAKDFTKEQYYTDIVHPTKEGHEIQADCLMYLVEKVDESELQEPKEIPESWCKSKPFTNFTRILGDDENVKITTGDFNGKDSTTQGLKKTGKGDFPMNWHHTKGSESFVMEITCKALIFTYKEQGSWLPEKFGKADIFVDGKKVATYDGGKAGGWCNCVPVYLIDNEKLATHTVEVRMADGDEAKGFTIVAMGYSK